MPRTTFRTVWRAAGLLGCLLLSSCQASKPPLFPVRGQVFVAGKPALGAVVTFHPAGSSGAAILRPSAVVKPDGSFTLQTYDPQHFPTPVDGAPAGEYLVTVQWVPPDHAAKSNVPTIPDKLQGRYNDPQTSGFQATVKAEPNDLPAFRLELNK